jgi:CheY-like chemotaxis protein/pSer/pThr/pTyr-binding forkhead associated (FHA) protein
MPVLRIKLPDNKGEITHVLAGERVSVGRRPDNTIQIIDRTVSAHHAEFIIHEGHYRLHDLGSTNLTCVNGQPITDFHLHEACKVNFGTIECEFSPESPVAAVDKSGGVPTKAEMEYLRRENLDLEAKIAAMQKQINILSSARLMVKDTQQMGVPPEVHKRLTQERDQLRNENAKLVFDLEHLRGDLAAMRKERDALRMAWETVKHERDALMARLDEAGIDAPDFVPSSPVGLELQRNGTPRAVEHLGGALAQVPDAVKAVRASIDELARDPNDPASEQRLANEVEVLVDIMTPAAGHPAQRLAVACLALIKDARSRSGRIEPAVALSIQQAMDVIVGLVESAPTKAPSDLPPARALVLDDDKDLLDTIGATLRTADLEPTTCAEPKKALEILERENFDLILLDIGLPGASGIDVCAKIRALPSHKRTPVLFMTAADSVENRVNTCVNGGDDFIAKPFNVLELAVKASTWVCRHQFGLKP